MSDGYLAVDLGAESGRVVLGRFDGRRVSLEEIHRFPNLPVRLPDGLHWDVLRILQEIKEGLAKAVRGEKIEGVGVDSWGVDFGILDRDGRSFPTLTTTATRARRAWWMRPYGWRPGKRSTTLRASSSSP